MGMFYFLTHGAYGPDARGPADVTKILKEHPEAIWDFDHPAWCDGAPLYWGEPLFGYYYLDDKWVLRRHIKLLTMAGVDFLVSTPQIEKRFSPRCAAFWKCWKNTGAKVSACRRSHITPTRNLAKP